MHNRSMQGWGIRILGDTETHGWEKVKAKQHEHHGERLHIKKISEMTSLLNIHAISLCAKNLAKHVICTFLL